MLDISPNLLFISSVSLLNSSCWLFLLGVDLELLSYKASTAEEGMTLELTERDWADILEVFRETQVKVKPTQNTTSNKAAYSFTYVVSNLPVILAR